MFWHDKYTQKTTLQDTDEFVLQDSGTKTTTLQKIREFIFSVFRIKYWSQATTIVDTDAVGIQQGDAVKYATVDQMNTFLNMYKAGDTVAWTNPYYATGLLFDNKLSIYYTIQLRKAILSIVNSATISGSLVSFNGDGGSVSGIVTLSSSNTTCTLNKSIGTITCKTTLTVAPTNTVNQAAILVNVYNATITFA